MRYATGSPPSRRRDKTKKNNDLWCHRRHVRRKRNTDPHERDHAMRASILSQHARRDVVIVEAVSPGDSSGRPEMLGLRRPQMA
jgi:hypothetical protein